jgi:CBS domain-containing protein
MSPVVHCIGENRPATEAAARMIREDIDTLVVVDRDYAVVGMLLARDLLRLLPGVEPRLALVASR